MFYIYTKQNTMHKIDVSTFDSPKIEVFKHVCKLLQNDDLATMPVNTGLIHYYYRGERVAVSVEVPASSSRPRFTKEVILDLILKLRELDAVKSTVRGTLAHYLDDAMIEELGKSLDIQIEK